MQSFLSNINRGYFENEKDAFKEFKTEREKIKDETLKEFVKELGLGLFGFLGDGEDKRDDEDKRNDGDKRNDEDKRDDGDDRSIGERVKLKKPR